MTSCYFWKNLISCYSYVSIKKVGNNWLTTQVISLLWGQTVIRVLRQSAKKVHVTLCLTPPSPPLECHILFEWPQKTLTLIYLGPWACLDGFECFFWNVSIWPNLVRSLLGSFESDKTGIPDIFVNEFREYVPVIFGLSTENSCLIPIRKYYGMIGPKYSRKTRIESEKYSNPEIFNGRHCTTLNTMTDFAPSIFIIKFNTSAVFNLRYAKVTIVEIEILLVVQWRKRFRKPCRH